MKREVEIFSLNDKNDVHLFDKISGIYGLLYENEIIYVGQSINIANRLKDHKRSSNINDIINRIIKEDGNCNRCKQLAMYYFLDEHKKEIEFVLLKECKIEELNYYEEKYITKFKPRFNYKGVIIPYK